MRGGAPGAWAGAARRPLGPEVRASSEPHFRPGGRARRAAVAGNRSRVPEPRRPAMGLLSDPVRRRALARLVLRLNAPLW